MIEPSHAQPWTRLTRSRPLRPLRTLLRPVKRWVLMTVPRVQREATNVWLRRLRGQHAIPRSQEFKAGTILEYASRFGTKTLIETGTYLGETIDRSIGHFEHIWSVELDNRLYEAAVRRFRPWPHITIVHGDSAQVLPSILNEVPGLILFWLDGHFSGGLTARGDLDTAVSGELSAILGRAGPGDVILIDDARDFGKGDYPSIRVVRDAILAKRPDWHFEVRDDIMRAHRPVAAGGRPIQSVAAQ